MFRAISRISFALAFAASAAFGAALWSGSVYVIQSRTDNANTVFRLDYVKQEGLHLTGGCSYTQTDERGQATVNLAGTDTKDGGFWPDVTAQIQNERGEWVTIARPVDNGHHAVVQIRPGETRQELLVTLDVFVPFIGQNSLGRLVLANGETAVFDLTELLEQPPDNTKRESEQGVASRTMLSREPNRPTVAWRDLLARAFAPLLAGFGRDIDHKIENAGSSLLGQTAADTGSEKHSPKSGSLRKVALTTRDARAGDKLWSRSLLGTPSSSAFHPFDVVLIELVMGNHLVATCRYANYSFENDAPPPVTVRGVKRRGGKFYPYVTASVTNNLNGKWRTIGELGVSGKSTSRRIPANTVDDSFTIELDAFRPLIGTFAYGSLVLPTGETAVFGLKDLLPPVQQPGPKSDSVARRQPKATGPAASAESTHVQKENDYRRILLSKLFVTRADCARMSVRPESAPEFSLAVYSKSRFRSHRRQRKTPSYYVTVTQASRNIYQSMQESRAINVSVDRFDAKIPARTAVALRELWKKMLSQASSSAHSTDAPINGEVIELSLATVPHSVSTEKFPVVAGERIESIQRLRELLMIYCNPEFDERDALAKTIRKDAQGLAKEL